jgi:hypothetical protein
MASQVRASSQPFYYCQAALQHICQNREQACDQPNRGTERYDAKDHLVAMLAAHFNGDVVTPEEQSEIISLNDLYDRIVFDKQVEVLPQFEDGLTAVLKQMVRQPTVTILSNWFRRKEVPRQTLLGQVGRALTTLIAERQPLANVA